MDEKFQVFSPFHVAFLATVSVEILLLALLRKVLSNKKVKYHLRYALAFLLLAVEVSEQAVALLRGTWDIRITLPLHLCGITSIACIVMLMTESYSIFEVVYFWGLIGSPLAMIFPDLSATYRDISFWQFMSSHSLNVISVIFMMTAYKYRPTIKSTKKTFFCTNIYMVFIACLNYLVGANYYYLYLWKDPVPQFHNPMKSINSWPMIILALELFSPAVIFLFYLPYAISDTAKRRKSITV